MAAGTFLLPLAALALGQSNPPVPDPPAGQDVDGVQNVEIRIGRDLQPLPFRLNLDSRARAPRSLTELVDRLYRAIPEDRLDMFAAYHGGEDLERMRARYDSTVDFFYNLYTIEILHEASRVWGFTDARFPLGPARRCVGDTFVMQVAIQLGARRLFERGGSSEPAPLRDMRGAYLQAAMISRQLFTVCDRRHPYSPRAR